MEEIGRLQLSVYFNKHGLHWNYGKSLQSINWVASAAAPTYTETKPSEMDLITRN